MRFSGLTEKYLDRDLELTEEQKMFASRVSGALPEKIIDAHAHFGLLENIKECKDAIYNNLFSSYPYFTLQDHRKTDRKLFGEGKIIQHVAFAFPFDGRDHKSSNEYIRDIAIQDHDIIPFLMGDIHDMKYTSGQLYSGFRKGIKMYPMQSEMKVEKIIDFYPDAVLEVLDDLGLPMILHLPHDLHSDLYELEMLLKKYPNIRFIIAHMGNTVFTKDDEMMGLVCDIKKLKCYENLYFDLSWFFNEGIVKLFVELLGSKKLVYGSDQPLNLLSCDFLYNKDLGDTRALSKNMYHRVDEKEREGYVKSRRADDIEMIHFKELKSIFSAIDWDVEMMHDIFYHNMKSLLK